jgi:hypothetical protein
MNFALICPSPRHTNKPISFPTSQMTLGDLNTSKESSLQGHEQDNARDFEESYQSMDAKPLQCLTCDWPSCKSITQYTTTRELKNHQTDVHIATILKDWPGSCSWPGCNSKIFFKTSKRLESHVYNIHITPLHCTATGCEHKRPFERQADLERHVASKHTKERKYKCPYPRCSYSSSFSRKDKLKLHERTYHGQFACQLNHCTYGFLSEEKVRKHQTGWSIHGRLECGLGSCGRTSTSCFWWVSLRDHLIYDHKISYEVANRAWAKVNYPKDTLTSAHFPDGFSDFQDCEGCIKKLKEAKPGKDGKEER